jgi:hypothetical protein
MTRSLAFALATLFTLPALAADAVKAPAESGEMKSIFNGKDLTGWDGDSRLWSVKDGVIHGETTDAVKANGNTFLIWKDGELKDFELRLSFRCSVSNNSGIQYRSKHITENARNEWVVKGYQHEIRNENTLPNVSGFIYDEGGLTGGRGRTCLVGEKAEWVADGKKGSKKVTDTLITAEEYSKLFKVDEWNDVIIIAKGRHLQHYMNDRLVLDFQDAEKNALLEGILALQLHAGKPMWAEFKNIRVKHIK